MTAAPFQVDDHVKTRASGVVPAGTPGTIVQALRSVWELFYVQFDGYTQPQLMRARELERVTVPSDSPSS
jgi:hypothetical protein